MLGPCGRIGLVRGTSCSRAEGRAACGPGAGGRAGSGRIGGSRVRCLWTWFPLDRRGLDRRRGFRKGFARRGCARLGLHGEGGVAVMEAGWIIWQRIGEMIGL